MGLVDWSQRIVIITSIVSSLSSVTVMIFATILFLSEPTWTNLLEDVIQWVKIQQWDSKISSQVISSLGTLSENNNLVLSSILIFSAAHFSFSILLIIGSHLNKRKLFLPWIGAQSLIIIIKTIIFSFCTFIMFFIDVLVFVVFPIVSGIILGISLLLMRLIWTAYLNISTKNEEEYIDISFED